MAKGNLFLSQARGKVGSVVFYRKDGEQVTRVHTSQVSNPKTSAQNLQRAIFYSVQRMAAGAKYLVEQGQENVKTGYKSRQAFVKKALNDLRNAVLSGQGTVLNVKGNPYMQAIPVSLTDGSLPTVQYSFADTDDVIIPTMFGSQINKQMTLQDFFNDNPSVGLNKQLTLVWLVADEDIRTDNPSIQGLNYHTKLHYAEIVFTNDAAALGKPAFVDGEDELVFNPEVLAPSWGGTDSFPEFALANQHVILPTSTIAFTAIVSDYTNNKWSRSYAPFAINPNAVQSPDAIAATYAADSSEITSEEYLDQADGNAGQTSGGVSPNAVYVHTSNADGTSNLYSMTRKSALAVNVAAGRKIDINVQARGTQNYNAESCSVETDLPGTITVLSPEANGNNWLWVLDDSQASPTGTHTIKLTTPDGAVRTITATWPNE